MMGCNRINSFDEGVEFAIQVNSNGEWVPITLVIRIDETDLVNGFVVGRHISIDGNVVDEVVIRDYRIAPDAVGIESIYNFSVRVCNFVADPLNSVQFRWLQTSIINIDGDMKDVWALDYVHISYHDQDQNINAVLLEDTFDDSELK